MFILLEPYNSLWLMQNPLEYSAFSLFPSLYGSTRGLEEITKKLGLKGISEKIRGFRIGMEVYAFEMMFGYLKELEKKNSERVNSSQL